MVAPIQSIVIPGFLGSTLSYRGGAGGGKTPLWFSPRALIAAGPASLGLAADGHSPGVGGRTLFADGPVDLGIYEPLLTALANGGLSPSFYGYDWRLDQRTIATALVAWLQTQVLADPFFVVAHSNGGLVAQLAYTAWAALAGPKSTWQTTVYLGTPHGGTYTAAQNLAGLYADGTYGAILWAVYQLGAVANPIAAAAAMLLQAQCAAVVCSWPSLYNLLPNPGGGWASLDPNASRLLLLATYGAGTPVQQQWLTAASAFHAAIVAGLGGARPYEVCLNGTSYSTALSVGAVLPPSSPFAYDHSNDGDGTVTDLRATLPVVSITRHDFDPCSHYDLCRTAAPLTDLLASYRPPSVPPTLGLLKVIPDLPPAVATPVPSPAPADPGRTVNPFINILGDP